MIAEAGESDELEDSRLSSEQSEESKNRHMPDEEGYQPFKVGGGSGASGLSQAVRDQLHPAIGQFADALANTRLAG